MREEENNLLPDPEVLLTSSTSVCLAMTKFHKALAQKAMACQDFSTVAKNLRAAELWEGAARKEQGNA